MTEHNNSDITNGGTGDGGDRGDRTRDGGAQDGAHGSGTKGQDAMVNEISTLWHNMPQRAIFLGIDHGRRYTGLALGYWPEILTVPLTTLQIADPQQVLKNILDIVRNRGINYVILGLPVHKREEKNKKYAGETQSSGKRVGAEHDRGERGHGRCTDKTHDYISHLYRALVSHCPVPVYYWDERYTSQWAQRLLRDPSTGHSYPKLSKRKIALNQLSAANILHTVLEFLKYKSTRV